MKDRLGQEIKEGSRVLYIRMSNRALRISKERVESFTARFARLESGGMAAPQSLFVIDRNLEFLGE